LGSAGNNATSAGTYFPWGENKGTTNPQNTWGFGTYWNDANSGLNYANNRYYNSALGRFMTPDPSTSSQSPNTPQSWNLYGYTAGEPVNANDPSGLYGCVITADDPDCDPDQLDPNDGGFSPPDAVVAGGAQGSDLGVLQANLGTLEQDGLSGWEPSATGVDLSFVGTGVIIGGLACAADPFCDVAAIAVGGAITIYVTWKYLPGLIQAIESRGRQNVADSGILEQAWTIMQEDKVDICEALDILYKKAKQAGDTQEMQKINRTRKQFNCRPSRQSPNR